VLGLLDALHALVQLALALFCRGEFLSGLRPDLPEGRLGPVELADQVVDPRLAADVVGADLGEPPLAVLELGLLGLRLPGGSTRSASRR
jgi:hypothetical protein